MPPDKFWDLAYGNVCFMSWLNRVDKICIRFLDLDLLSIPEAMEEPYYPDVNYEDNMSPEAYFLYLLHSMKQGSPAHEVDRQVARMAKWGDQWPALLG